MSLGCWWLGSKRICSGVGPKLWYNWVQGLEIPSFNHTKHEKNDMCRFVEDIFHGGQYVFHE